jgi:hypothetical protein
LPNTRPDYNISSNISTDKSDDNDGDIFNSSNHNNNSGSSSSSSGGGEIKSNTTQRNSVSIKLPSIPQGANYCRAGVSLNHTYYAKDQLYRAISHCRWPTTLSNQYVRRSTKSTTIHFYPDHVVTKK